MALVTLKEILEPAVLSGTAVGAFDISSLGMLETVLSAAEESASPVILMALKADIAGHRLPLLVRSMIYAAGNSPVPVCVHLDHAVDTDIIRQCLDAGFSSVMYDGSSLPLEENILNTGKVVTLAKSYGASVEAELGHVGDARVGIGGSNSHASVLTRPVEMNVFIKETSVDALAVAIGTLHGVFKQEPKLEWELLEHLAMHSPVPLVLHGGSGTSDEDLKKLVKFGIRKVNIYSELLQAYYGRLKEELNQQESMALWPSFIEKNPLERVREVVQHKLKVLGTGNFLESERPR